MDVLKNEATSNVGLVTMNNADITDSLSTSVVADRWIKRSVG